MGTGAFNRDTYSSGAYIEDALRSRGRIFQALSMGHVLTPMGVEGYVAQSKLCHAFADYVGPSLISSGSPVGHTFAYLRGMDGAYKVAQEVRVLAKVRFALKPSAETVLAAGSMREPILRAMRVPTHREIENLTNEANAYYFSSEAARNVGDAAIPILTNDPKHGTAVTLGFAAGLMLAHYGAMEALHDATESDDRIRQCLGVMALGEAYGKNSHQGGSAIEHL